MRINNNDQATRSQAAYLLANSARSKSLEKLATALRINRASDDAAGLAVSEGLRSQIRQSQMSQRNASDGESMMRIAESGAEQITDSLQRMRELAMQSSNGTLNDNDRKAIQAEYQQLKEHITGVAQSTNFNGQPLLTGAASGISFQVGGDAGASSTISLAGTSDLSTDLGLGDVGTSNGAKNALAGIDAALKTVLTSRTSIGATSNRLERTASSLGAGLPNLVDAESRIRDTDFAKESTNLVRSQILGNSSAAMLSQANRLPAGVLSLLHS